MILAILLKLRSLLPSDGESGRSLIWVRLEGIGPLVLEAWSWEVVPMGKVWLVGVKIERGVCGAEAKGECFIS